MKKDIENRKSIIKSLKPTIAWGSKSIEKRVEFLKGITAVYIILTTLCAGILILTILAEIIGFKFTKWENIGLLAILSVSFVLNLPNQLYELKLTKHLIKLNSQSNLNGSESLNNELRKIIEQLNNRIKNNWLTLLLALIILVLGILQMGTENNSQVWGYMKIPMIIFYGIILLKFWKTNKSLSRNINDAENTVANNVYNS